MRVSLGGPGAMVGIDVVDEALVPAVQALFRPLLAPAGPSMPPDFVLERAGSGFRIVGVGGAEGPVRFRSLSRALSVLEHQATLRLLGRWRDFTFLHAGGVRPDRGTLLVVGPSGSGKSSLVLAASVAGIPVLSDDCVVVDGESRVRGLPRLIKVHRRQLRLHGLSEADTVAADPRVPEVWWDPVRSGGWATAWEGVGMVARVAREPGRRIPLVLPLSRAAGARVLMDNLLAGGKGEGESLDRLLGVAREADFVDLRFASAERGMEALLAMAGPGGS